MRVILLLVATVGLASAASAQAPVREKVFIPPVKGEKINADVLSAMFDLVVVAVDRANMMRVVTMDDVNSMLDQEKRKDAVGCSSISCAVELGGALGVRYLLATRVKKLGPELLFTASLIDTKEQESKNGQGRCTYQAAEYDRAVNAAIAEALGLVSVGLSTEPAAAARDRAPSPGGAPRRDGASARGEVAGVGGVAWVNSAVANVDFTRTETTVAQYAQCLKAGSCAAKNHDTKDSDEKCNAGYADRGEHPMNCVNSLGAEQFCRWIGGRLPTEDEWQLEASNEGARAYAWGGEPVSCSYAVWGDGDRPDGCSRNSTAPVCSKPRGNSLSGLCDMTGNVWEWTSSSDGAARILRGGSWSNDEIENVSVMARRKLDPVRKSSRDGFRCVRSPN